MRNPKGLVPLCEILWRFEPVFVTENVCGRAFIDELASDIANDLPAQYQKANGSAGTSSQSNTVKQVNAIASWEAQSPKGHLNIGRPSPLLLRMYRAPLSRPQAVSEWRKVQSLWNHGRHLDLGML
jgi:hypothetical protein